MSKQQILDQMKDLLNIPQIERLVHHKLEELKMLFDDEIKLYNQSRDKFRKSVYGNLKVLDNDDYLEKRMKYHFELDIADDLQWQVTTVEPTPPHGCHSLDIVPQPIILHMASHKVNPGKIETNPKFTLPELEGKLFDLEFTVFSNQHILGTIKHYSPWQSFSENLENQQEDDANADTIYYSDAPTVDDESSVKELLYYINNYPAVKSYFFTELDIRMKPLIHGNLVEVNANSQPVDLF